MDTKYRAQFKRHGMRKISKKTVFTQKEDLQRILCKNKRNYCQTVTLGFTSWIADAIESTLEKQKKKKKSSGTVEHIKDRCIYALFFIYATFPVDTGRK